VTSASGASLSPRETLEAGVAKVVAAVTLAPSDGRDSPRAAAWRRARVREIVAELVDFEEMTRRALGSHWTSLFLSERGEFVDLFTKLLDHAYLGKLQMLANQRMSFVRETVTGHAAVVTWRISGPPTTDLAPDAVRRVADTEIEYWLHRRNGQWRVYDLGLDGFRLVEIYRRQFSRVIQAESYAALVARLRQKIAGFSPALPRF
jgi:phospholipid transport system substrate-binding protein